jgi:hypothetical protein
MDSTMLVLSDDLSTRGPLVRLTIRDCTVNTNDNYLTDLRTKPATLTFLRARFIGFDTGAGGATLLDAAAHGFMLRAVDSRFEGGYGRTPWSCNFLDVRNNALVARFERCRFSQLSLSMQWWGAGSTVFFSGCTFEDMLDRQPLTSHAADRPGVIFDGGSFTYFGGDPTQVPSKDLNALFPDWQARIQ